MLVLCLGEGHFIGQPCLCFVLPFVFTSSVVALTFSGVINVPIDVFAHARYL